MIIPGEGYRNYGTGIIAAQYGSDPSVFLSANPANGGGGDSSLNMYYTVQYNAPTLLPGTLVLTQVTASETVNQVGLSAASATMIVSGPTGDIYVGYDCAAAAGAAFGCASTAAPFGNELVVMEANVPYTVELSLEIYAHGNVLAEIDPRFSASASYGGQFVFSPGITGGVPEPSTWAMMLIGFAGLGFAAYRQSKKGPAACGIV
jgi:hypothetical protein